MHMREPSVIIKEQSRHYNCVNFQSIHFLYVVLKLIANAPLNDEMLSLCAHLSFMYYAVP